jgi:hypothetical protein
MSFIDAFFGSTQSQFTAYAIFAAVVSICISIILTGTDMTIGNRFLLIFFVILAVLPSILLMLLQITCMVTGGNKDDHWWCWLYSWIIAIFVIIYCVFVVIISLSSLFTYNNAISKVDMSEQNNKMSPENSNNYAKMMINTNTPDAIEKFMNSEDEEDDKYKISMVGTESFEDKKEKSDKVLPEKSKSPEPPLTPPTPSIPSPPTPIQPSSKDEGHIVKEKYSSTELLDDQYEAFTNRNYASF